MLYPDLAQHRLLRTINLGDAHRFFAAEDYRAEGDDEDGAALALEVARNEAWCHYQDARQEPLARCGCIEWARPWQTEPGCWIVEAFLTEHGEAALKALDEGLIWDADVEAADLGATERWYRTMLPSRLGAPIGDHVLKRIARVTHPLLRGVVNDAMLLKLAYDPA